MISQQYCPSTFGFNVVYTCTVYQHHVCTCRSILIIIPSLYVIWGDVVHHYYNTCQLHYKVKCAKSCKKIYANTGKAENLKLQTLTIIYTAKDVGKLTAIVAEPIF